VTAGTGDHPSERAGEPAVGRWVPIWETVVAAYSLALRSVLRFPVTSLAVAAVLFGIEAYALPLSLESFAPPPLLTALLDAIVRAIVLAPFAILIHRSIILGETSGSYMTMGAHRRARQFVAVARLLVLVQQITGWVAELDRYSAWFILPGLICTIASIVIDIRLCLAFPAIATDQSEMPIRDSFRYVRGSGLAIFFVFFFMALCWAPIGIPLFFADRLALVSEHAALLIALRVVQQLLAIFMIAVYVAAASRLWQTRASWSEAAMASAGAAA
jgi:hypothetical protein